VTPAIRRASRADAGRLAEFAARTFSETYAAFNDPADMSSHLAAKYSEAKQAAEIADPGGTYLLAELDGRLVGYALVVGNRAPDGMALPAPVEVVRFYVASDWHGRGVAQSLMAACIAEGRRRGGGTLWLGVWQENPRAIAFYLKAGFRIVGTTSFRLGSQVQDDHVMAMALHRAGEAP
jgi:ribosomal protein S18 acetylase RimI-like enzyme